MKKGKGNRTMKRAGKRTRRYLAVLLAAVLFVNLFVTTGVSAKTQSGTWVQAKGGKWWFKYEDGTWPADSWLKYNNRWYHFDKNGWMQTGWIKDGTDWYYLNKSGAMRTGWVKYAKKWYYMNKSGKLHTGWLKCQDQWYYFGDDGAMMTGTITVKGKTYVMGADGAFISEGKKPTKYADALTDSGFRMLQKVYAKKASHNQNVLLSPTSAHFALGMAAAGSDEGTKTQKELMEALLPGCNAKPEDLNAEMAAMSERMSNTKCPEQVSWNVANSVWSKTGDTVKLKDSYLETLKESYSAEVHYAPFDETTVDEVNDWVKENTRERIPKILNDLSEDTVALLINALAFDGQWAETVDDSRVQDGTFTNADGTTSTVQMMSTHEDRAILLNGGVGVIKPYLGGDYSFVAILPKEGQTAEDYLKAVVKSGDSFAEAYLNADRTRGVNAQIPEFKTEYGILLNDTLKAMGVKDAFSPDRASFRTMITDESDPIYITKVIQKSMIKVDRKGTEAAAATVVVFDKATAVLTEEEPYSVILDRPFVYAIVDNATGVPIFLGIQNSMPDAE